mgnify:FL=1
MSDVVLVGPFWTRSETAAYLGISPNELRARVDVLRIEGRWLEETYPALQFSDHEVRFEVAAVVDFVGAELPGTAVADWLTRPNPELGALTPLQWFDSGQDVNVALHVAQSDVEAAAARVSPRAPLVAAG